MEYYIYIGAKKKAVYRLARVFYSLPSMPFSTKIFLG